MLIIILNFSAYNFHYCTGTMEFVFSIFVPIRIYQNPDTDKTNILLIIKENPGFISGLIRSLARLTSVQQLTYLND